MKRENTPVCVTVPFLNENIAVIFQVVSLLPLFSNSMNIGETSWEWRDSIFNFSFADFSLFGPYSQEYLLYLTIYLMTRDYFLQVPYLPFMHHSCL